DALIKEAGVNCILNLSDNDAKIEKYMVKDDFNSPYFAELYNKGNVYPIALNMNYLSDEFASKIAQGFIDISQKEGPYLIHCTEGKDRTGFVCMLIEALAGAGYQEIADDYMVTYDNYYEINEVKDPRKYKVILEKNLDAMLKFVVGDEKVDIKTAELSGYARSYLLKAGMSNEQIDRFLRRITR
ncbi:MAG: tyrosine-protein phosphatase, partial [Erysipelotrichaceae bacterium]|nr:tyrosine-protein phosphatase [Erysipelotrichaceae bacterium]